MANAARKGVQQPPKPARPQEVSPAIDPVEEASEESFPASDSPAWPVHEEPPKSRKGGKQSK